MCATRGAPPAALFFDSPDRRGEHVERRLAGFAGILQADAYRGFNRLYETSRQPAPITEAACWAHGWGSSSTQPNREHASRSCTRRPHCR